MFIFSNLATSLDGKIATASRVHFPLGTPEDRRMMQVLRRKADAVLMGASTLRAFKGPIQVFGAKKQPLNILLSSNLEGVSPNWKFFKDTRIRRILFVSGPLPAAKRAQFEKTSEIITLKKISSKNSASRQIVTALEKRGVQRLLVEGGGGVMWDFVSQNLIHEYHVTVTPWLVGGVEAPTLVDGKGFDPRDVLKLKLKKAKVLGNEIYLTYCRIL